MRNPDWPLDIVRTPIVQELTPSVMEPEALMHQAFTEIGKFNFVRKLCIACMVFIWPDEELHYTYQYIFEHDSSHLTRVSRFLWMFALQITMVFAAVILCYAFDKMQRHY